MLGRENEKKGGGLQLTQNPRRLKGGDSEETTIEEHTHGRKNGKKKRNLLGRVQASHRQNHRMEETDIKLGQRSVGRRKGKGTDKRSTDLGRSHRAH